MKAPEYSFYSKSELIEIIHNLNNELKSYEQINKTLNKENKILLEELVSVVPRVEKIEQFKKTIEEILNSSTTCKAKIDNIGEVL